MKKIFILTLFFFPLFFIYGQWTLKFSNSDSIYCSSFSLADGKISAISTKFENAVLIRNFEALESARKSSENQLSSPYLLKLKSLNQIRCSIEEIKNDFLIAKTEFSDGFRIPLAEISELITCEDVGMSSLPTELNWQDNSRWQHLPANFAGNFRIIENKILMKAPLISSIECPFKRVKISFYALMNYDYGISVQLFSNLEKNGLETYLIHLFPYSVDALKISETSQKSLVNNKRLNEFAFGSFLNKYEIAADCEKGIFEIVINDTTRFRFNDNDGKKVSGKKIAFVCPADFALISNLRVSEWDSSPLEIVGTEPNQTLQSSSSDKDTVFLKNKDCISGKLIQITPDTVTFKTDFATLQIPSEKVAKIAMRKPENDNTSLEDNKKKFSHRIYIGGSSFLAVKPLSADGKIMIAETAITGSPLKINLSYVSAICKNEISPQAPQSNSLFDEMIKMKPFNESNMLDNLDDEKIEELEKELGDLFEFFY